MSAKQNAPIKDQTKLKGMAAIDEYLRNGYDAIAAYQSVYPNANRSTASNEFARMKKRPFFAQYLEEQRKLLWELKNIDKQRVMEEVAEMAFVKNDDKNVSPQVKAKTLEMLYKMLSEDAATAADNEVIIELEDDNED